MILISSLSLHSTVALLEGTWNVCRWTSIEIFTFYCSSIRRETLPLWKIQFEDFTFYCSSIRRTVEIESCLKECRTLHSTVALLEVCPTGWSVRLMAPFTFYCSSIRSNLIRKWNPRNAIFTFYCSSIRSRGFYNAKMEVYHFTFYCSSIRSEIETNERGGSQSTLHSTVALLEELIL